MDPQRTQELGVETRASLKLHCVGNIIGTIGTRRAEEGPPPRKVGGGVPKQEWKDMPEEVLWGQTAPGLGPEREPPVTR